MKTFLLLTIPVLLLIIAYIFLLKPLYLGKTILDDKSTKEKHSVNKDTISEEKPELFNNFSYPDTVSKRSISANSINIRFSDDESPALWGLVFISNNNTDFNVKNICNDYICIDPKNIDYSIEKKQWGSLITFDDDYIGVVPSGYLKYILLTQSNVIYVETHGSNYANLAKQLVSSFDVK